MESNNCSADVSPIEASRIGAREHGCRFQNDSLVLGQDHGNRLQKTAARKIEQATLFTCFTGRGLLMRLTFFHGSGRQLNPGRRMLEDEKLQSRGPVSGNKGSDLFGDRLHRHLPPVTSRHAPVT